MYLNYFHSLSKWWVWLYFFFRLWIQLYLNLQNIRPIFCSFEKIFQIINYTGVLYYLKAVCTSLKVLFSNGSKRKYSNYTNEEISLIDKSTNTYQFLNLMSVTKVTSFSNYLFYFVFLPFRLFTNSFISNVDVGRRKRRFTTRIRR